MKKIITFLGLVFALSLGATPALAGSAVISASSSTTKAKVGETFTVTVRVSGGGTQFTSFGANVSVNNLTVVSLTKSGDVAKWVDEPSTSSLKFTGAVTGQTSAVTVYTLKVKGKKAGDASVSISGGSVTHTDGFNVEEILGSQSGAKIKIEEATVAAKPAETKPAEETPVVTQEPPKPLAVVLPEDETVLETEWQKYNPNPSLDLAVSLNPTTVKYDPVNGTLSGLRLSGLATPNALVTVFIFSNKITKTATAGADGKFEIIVDEALTDGLHTVFATVSTPTEITRLANSLYLNIDSERKVVETAVDRPISTDTPIIDNLPMPEQYNYPLLYQIVTLSTNRQLVGGVFLLGTWLLSIILTYILARRKEKSIY